MFLTITCKMYKSDSELSVKCRFRTLPSSSSIYINDLDDDKRCDFCYLILFLMFCFPQDEFTQISRSNINLLSQLTEGYSKLRSITGLVAFLSNILSLIFKFMPKYWTIMLTNQRVFLTEIK